MKIYNPLPLTALLSLCGSHWGQGIALYCFDLQPSLLAVSIIYTMSLFTRTRSLVKGSRYTVGRDPDGFARSVVDRTTRPDLDNYREAKRPRNRHYQAHRESDIHHRRSEAKISAE